MKTECNYPDCKCPFDMGADNKCLQGLPQKEKAINQCDRCQARLPLVNGVTANLDK